MLIGLAIFNVSLLLSPVLFLEERMELFLEERMELKF